MCFIKDNKISNTDVKNHINEWVSQYPELFLNRDPAGVNKQINDIFNKKNGIKSIIPNSNDKYYKNSIAMIDNYMKELIDIISDESLDNEQKQKFLECINTPFSAKVKNLTHQINPICHKAITEIDALLLPCKNVEELYKKIMGNDKVRYNALNPEKKKGLDFLFAFISISKSNKESPGLSIIFYFAKTLRQITNKVEQIYEGNQNEKISEFNEDTRFKLKETYITINKTSSIMMMASELISQCIILQGIHIRNEHKKKENPNEIKQILLRQEVGKTFPELNELEQAEFAIFLAHLLESTKIITESLDFGHGNGIHKQKIYRLSKKAIDMFFSIHAYDLVTPMICKPQDWQQTEKTGMNFGGFMMNETGAYPGVHLRSKNSTTFVDTKTIATVNHLQSQAFEINWKELDNIIKDETPYLENYLEMSAEHWKECFYMDKERNMKMYTETEYISSNTKELEKQLKEKNLSILENNAIKYKISKKAEKLSIKYKTVIACIVKFIYMLKLANTLRYIKLYYPMYLCGRGRFYPIGFGIFPHGDALAKLLLKLDIGEIEGPRTKDESLQLIKFLDKPKIKGKDFFELRNLIQEDRNVVGIDVSNSGPQILSGVVGDLKGLFDTNFCVLPIDQESLDKKDLYKIVLNKVQEYFKIGKPAEILWANINDTHVEEINDKQIENLRKLESAMPEVMTLFDRNLLKEWVMQFVYSEGDHARSTYLANKIENLFDKNEKLKGAFTRSDYYTLGRIFSLCFVEAITDKYSDMCDLSTKLQELFGKIEIKNCSIKITSQSDGLFTSLYISDQISKETYYISPITHMKNKISIKINTNKPNRKKAQRSIVPNWIHNLDSEILKELVFNFMMLDKPIWVIHDNYLVNPDDIELAKFLYFESFVKCIFKEDPLKNLLNANIYDCDTSDKILEFIDEKFPDKEIIGKRKKKTFQEFEKQRQDIYTKIKNKEIVQSPRILS